ncbi:MAG: Fur family transcriptional regulator [Symbiobacteriia bacterium]
MPDLLHSIYTRLAERDYKITPQRQVILKALMDRAQGGGEANHLSADQVHAIVHQTNPEVGLATVYRTLDLLAELGILQKVNFGDGRSRYEFTEARTRHHHHLVCVQCGRVVEFTDALARSLDSIVDEQLGFRILDQELTIYGYCSECRQA